MCACVHQYCPDCCPATAEDRVLYARSATEWPQGFGQGPSGAGLIHRQTFGASAPWRGAGRAGLSLSCFNSLSSYFIKISLHKRKIFPLSLITFFESCLSVDPQVSQRRIKVINECPCPQRMWTLGKRSVLCLSLPFPLFLPFPLLLPLPLPHPLPLSLSQVHKHTHSYTIETLRNLHVSSYKNRIPMTAHF